MPEPTKIIYVSWTDWESGKKFLTDQHTQVRVARAAIPILFVPGIMGSRLRKAGGTRAWDPDDSIWMLRNFFNATGAARRDLLIKDPLEVNSNEAGGQPTVSFTERMQLKYSIATYGRSVPAPPDWDWLGLPQSMPDEDKLDKTIAKLIDHGWDQISWGFYGEILLKLAEGHMSELSRSFVHPVYAFGYNWIADNQQAGDLLAKRITQIINQENFANHPCDKVILISHSMGGLVTRSCVIHSGEANSKVLGIIHGAQPATGAPAAYRRMRAGFETGGGLDLSGFITSKVLGADDARVIPILANCVGGLELLPTQDYRTNSGSQQWLSLSGQNGKQADALPKGDPYSEIYWSDNTKTHKLDNNEQFLRLIIHPELLNPSSGSGTAVSRPGLGNADPLKGFQTNLTVAQQFHKTLSTHVHQNTYVTYTGHGGPPTFDKIHFSYLGEQDAIDYTVPDGAGGGVDVPYEVGTGIDLDQNPPGSKAPQLFRLDKQDGNGDGTVPVSSSRALLDHNTNVKANNATVRDDKGKLVPADIAHVEHGAFFSNADAIRFTLMAIRQLDWKYRFEKIGK